MVQGIYVDVCGRMWARMCEPNHVFKSDHHTCMWRVYVGVCGAYVGVCGRMWVYVGRMWAYVGVCDIRLLKALSLARLNREPK